VKHLSSCVLLLYLHEGQIESLEAFTKLRTLKLCRNNIIYVGELESCFNLWHLDLSNNNVSLTRFLYHTCVSFHVKVDHYFSVIFNIHISIYVAFVCSITNMYAFFLNISCIFSFSCNATKQVFFDILRVL